MGVGWLVGLRDEQRCLGAGKEGETGEELLLEAPPDEAPRSAEENVARDDGVGWLEGCLGGGGAEPPDAAAELVPKDEARFGFVGEPLP